MYVSLETRQPWRGESWNYSRHLGTTAVCRPHMIEPQGPIGNQQQQQQKAYMVQFQQTSGVRIQRSSLLLSMKSLYKTPNQSIQEWLNLSKSHLRVFCLCLFQKTSLLLTHCLGLSFLSWPGQTWVQVLTWTQNLSLVNYLLLKLPI